MVRALSALSSSACSFWRRSRTTSGWVLGTASWYSDGLKSDSFSSRGFSLTEADRRGAGAFSSEPTTGWLLAEVSWLRRLRVVLATGVGSSAGKWGGADVSRVVRGR